jgi:uncharacterized protein (TIGR00730 family)
MNVMLPQPLLFATCGEGRAYLRGRELKSWIACLGSGKAEPDHATLGAAYRDALDFALSWAECTRLDGRLPVGVATGGGPGCMAAFNEGAALGGAPSIAVCMHFEGELPNPFSDPPLRLKILQFEDRQRLLLEHASAIVAVTGGFGTAYELFDVVTKVNTATWAMRPIVMIGRTFAQPLVGFIEHMVECRTVSETALDLIRVVDGPDEAVDFLKDALLR